MEDRKTDATTFYGNILSAGEHPKEGNFAISMQGCKPRCWCCEGQLLCEDAENGGPNPCLDKNWREKGWYAANHEVFLNEAELG